MKKRLLFTGYAPVHFLCFQPIYERLVQRDDVEIFVSGGFRVGGDRETGFRYDEAGMFLPLGVPAEHILTTEAVQTQHFDALFCANKRVIAARENFGRLIQIFHGVSFRNRAVRPENLVYDHFFLVGPYMRRKFAEAGMEHEVQQRGVDIGFPKTDPLVDRRDDRERLRTRAGFSGDRALLLYAPTGEADNSLETMGMEVIERLARSGRFDLMVKPHDHPKNDTTNWFDLLGRFEDEHTRIVRAPDVVPLLGAADLLITDASSVANEFTLLDRPIVFLDVPELLQRSAAGGAALDLQRWGRKGGVVVERPDEVVEAVTESLAEPERLAPVRQAIAKDLFFNPGRATDAAMDWIGHHLLDCRAG